MIDRSAEVGALLAVVSPGPIARSVAPAACHAAAAVGGRHPRELRLAGVVGCRAVRSSRLALQERSRARARARDACAIVTTTALRVEPAVRGGLAKPLHASSFRGVRSPPGGGG